MGLHDFWSNVRIATKLARLGRVADTARLTSDELTHYLTSNYAWARPQSVRGFREEDFDFLPVDERVRLVESVNNFLQVVGADGSRMPTLEAEQLEKARQPFQAIVEAMEFDRFEDSEAFRLGKLVEGKMVPKPPHLDHLRFRTGYDSTGDPALWVWVYVAETGGYDDARFLARADAIEAVLKPIARAVAPEGRVYLHFRSTSDLLDAQEVAA